MQILLTYLLHIQFYKNSIKETSFNKALPNDVFDNCKYQLQNYKK